MKKMYVLGFLACLTAGCGVQTSALSIGTPPLASSDMSSSVSSSVRSRVTLSAAASARALSSSSSSTPATTGPVSLPILVYHHVRETKSYPKSTWSWKMSVTEQTFQKHMTWIREHGYTTIDLDTAAAILRGERAGPTKPVVITFDDNNRSQYVSAFPILKKEGLIAVFYMVANRLENASFITAAEVREMADAGMSIQSHTVTHATMTALSLAKLDAEIQESRATLEALVGKPVRHIAYPSTAQNKTVRDRVKAAGYVTGVIMDPRRATEKDDLMKLPRIMMTDDTNLASVLP